MHIHFIVVRTCDIEGCERKHHAKGLCGLHYRQLPENKLRQKEYESKPERKLYKKEYNSKPERKLWQKEYESKPETKLKRNQRNSKPENKLKKKEYNKQHPEIFLKSKQKLFKKLGKILGYPPKQIPMLYYSWAKTVKKILGNYCQVCGSIKQIEVHHIFHKVKYPLLSLNENNGMPLCKLCHLQADGKMLLV